jgi:TPR repeat protein/serine/threonine protein kinase
MSSPIRALTPGTSFARDFRVIRPLKEGGMGAVYVVEQISTGAQRALKLMHPELVQNASMRKRFEQEARVSAMIESDHVVQVLAAGVDEETGFPWLVMELLKGEELAAYLDRIGVVSAAETNEIFQQLGHALSAAHGIGVVHRDLKPENIFIGPAQTGGSRFRIKILDFGIARVVAATKGSSTAAVGTPLWMAPEQTESGNAITPAADVWALGLIAFRMLSGRSYWRCAASEDTDAVKLIREIVFEPLSSASERARQLGAAPLPPGFDAWFACAVARDPAARFVSAGPAVAALAQVLASAPSSGVAPYVPPTHNAGFTYGSVTPASVGSGLTATGGEWGRTGEPARSSSSPAIAVSPNARTEAHAPLPIASHTIAQPPMPPPQVTAPAPYQHVAQPMPQQAPYSPPKKGGSSAVGLVVGALAVVLVGGGAAAYALSHRGAASVAACENRALGADERRDACDKACASHSAASCLHLGELWLRDKASDRGARALGAFEKACNATDGARNLPACARAGELYATGVFGVARDPEKARATLTPACEAPDGASCRALATLSLDAREGPIEPAKASPHLDRACTLGDGIGCTLMGLMAEGGVGVARDADRAAKLFGNGRALASSACEAGDANACAAHGLLLATARGGDKDEAKALASLTVSCESGSTIGCTNLGAAYALGQGVTKDSARAKDVWSSACEAGEATACANLGLLIAGARVVMRVAPHGAEVFKLSCGGIFQTGCSGFGDVVDLGGGNDADPKKAAELSKRACDAGVLDACVNAGAFTFYGRGTTRDPLAAKGLFERACDHGNAAGCGELGALFLEGKGVAIDEAKAAGLLERACSLGEDDACVTHAALEESGRGVPKEPTHAYGIVKSACERGVPMACESQGFMMAMGSGTPADSVAGVALLKKTCEVHASTCATLGDALVKSNAAEASGYYKRACDGGFPAGCRALAQQREAARDHAEARALLVKPCDEGDSKSCNELGVLTLELDSKAFATAADFYRRACEAGSQPGCANWGALMYEGKNIPRDTEQGGKLLRTACQQKVTWACEKMRALQVR